MASTNFKVFNEANASANTYNDSEYNLATQRLTGVTPGMALSRMHNKMYFQWSVMATAIAQYLVSNGYDAMDNDLSGIKDALDKSCGINTRQNSTQYAVGDIKYSAALASYLFLECTVAGISASSIPTALATAAEGDIITDGTVTWVVCKAISLQDVKNLISAHNKDAHAHPNRLRPGLQRLTAYEVGDIAFHDSLPSWAYLECVTAGTTADTEPVFGGATEN